MSNSFEINVQADEWLDITSKEEVLQTKLNKANNELETRSMELLEYNVTIDLLKGHKTLLENERDSLTTNLQQSSDEIMKVKKELDESIDRKEFLKKEFVSMKNSSERNAKNLEQSLSSCKQELECSHTEIGSLNNQISTLKTERQKERNDNTNTIERLAKLVENLNVNIRSLENASKEQEVAFAQSQKEVQESRAREEALRRELTQQKRETELSSKELKESRTDIGSVSILAEDLRSKNNVLVRSMTSLQQHLNETKKGLVQSSARETSLKVELTKVKADAQSSADQLQQRISESAAKLEHSSDRVVGLETYAQDLKEQCFSLSEERQQGQGDLAEKEALYKELDEQKVSLEEELQELTESTRTYLEKAKGALAREKTLKEELSKQKSDFDARLREIRSILGMSAIAGIKTEIKTVQRLYGVHGRLQTSPACPPIRQPNLCVPLLVDSCKSN